MKVKELISQLLQNNVEFFSGLRIRKKLNQYAKQNGIEDLYLKTHQQYDPVFVLSTGRCGTAFLTRLLALEKSVKAYHEPQPEFFYHAKMAYHDYLSEPYKISVAFDVARYELIRNTFIDGKKYFETNNRVTFFAHQIAVLYPNAKFIHLIRNPSSFIKSGIGRNWYSGFSLYDEGRIRLTDEIWKNKTQIQKIAWLWQETNQFIENFKSKCDSSRILTVKAEELFKSIEIQKSIFNFTNVPVPKDTRIRRATSKKINEGSTIILNNEQRIQIDKSLCDLNLRSKYNY